MFILTKTNYQDFESNVEKFDTLKEAQDAMQSYYAEDKKTVEGFGGDENETDDGVTFLINDYCAMVRCDEFWMEYEIYDFSKPNDDSKTEQ